MNIQDKIYTETAKKIEKLSMLIEQDINGTVSGTATMRLLDVNGNEVRTITQPIANTQLNQIVAGQMSLTQFRAWFLQQNGITLS